LGLHEVARELENPFSNAPNDLPLTTFQAQFNEALVTVYAGFHPDSWYEKRTVVVDSLLTGSLDAVGEDTSEVLGDLEVSQGSHGNVSESGGL